MANKIVIITTGMGLVIGKSSVIPESGDVAWQAPSLILDDVVRLVPQQDPGTGRIVTELHPVYPWDKKYTKRVAVNLSGSIMSELTDTNMLDAYERALSSIELVPNSGLTLPQ